MVETMHGGGEGERRDSGRVGGRQEHAQTFTLAKAVLLGKTRMGTTLAQPSEKVGFRGKQLLVRTTSLRS